MLNWLTSPRSDSARRRDAAREISDGQIKIDPAAVAIMIVLLGMIYGLCMGSFSLLKEVPDALKDSNGRYLQLVCDSDQSAGVVLSDAHCHLSIAVRVQCVGRFAIDSCECVSAAGRIAGREPGRSGVAWADRDVLFADDEELRVHSVAERGGVHGGRRVGPDIFTANVASIDLATGFAEHCRRLPTMSSRSTSSRRT